MALTAVQIDQREPTWIQQLTFGGIPTAVTLLEYGDVVATTDDGQIIAVERKTADDLLNSLRDDRLMNQLAGLAQVTKWAYLVVTGELRRSPDGHAITARGVTGWSWAAVQGALLSAQELGIFVLGIHEDSDFEATLLRLGSRSRGELHIVPARVSSVLTAGEAALASLPGIGIERTAALLDYAGYPGAAICYLTDMSLGNGEHVPGVGPVTKQKVRKALGLPNWAELAVITTEGKLAETKGGNGNVSK